MFNEEEQLKQLKQKTQIIGIILAEKLEKELKKDVMDIGPGAYVHIEFKGNHISIPDQPLQYFIEIDVDRNDLNIFWNLNLRRLQYLSRNIQYGLSQQKLDMGKRGTFSGEEEAKVIADVCFNTIKDFVRKCKEIAKSPPKAPPMTKDEMKREYGY